MKKLLWMLNLCALALCLPAFAMAQTSPGPLRIEITDGVVQPVPLAAPDFIAADGATANYARDITSVIVNNLTGSGLFREIPKSAFISQITNFNTPPVFPDWQAINAQALITGETRLGADGRLVVDFRLWDVFSQRSIGDGVRFSAAPGDWRRIGHKVSDTVYSRLTGESGYFDSEITFVAESGPKNNRRKRIAIMDQDGANVRYLTGGNALVFAPRFSPDGRQVLYTSYATGVPRVVVQPANGGSARQVSSVPGMTFAPRFSPDGRRVILSRASGGNTDIYSVDLGSGQQQRLTRSPAIDTAPSYSPDGREIVFESDRGGSQQLYVMGADGSGARRISFGSGQYGTPVWSPRGDKIAFTKQTGGRFHVGVMDRDGSNEILLTASFLDEGPTWAPNGRVLMFFRETPGPTGAAALVSVDVTGRNLKYVDTPAAASDPFWSPLRTD
ncbi:MAG: Tol-Pal system beta propeller repeat protein TolB [Pseudomonadota bacterium]